MKNVMIAVVLSMFAVSSFADDHSKNGQKTQPQKAEHYMQKMTKKLELTPRQEKDIKAVYEETKIKKEALDKQYNIEAYKKEKKALVNNSHESVAALTQKYKIETYKEEKRALVNDSHSKIEALLSDEQIAKFKKMKKKKRKNKNKKRD